MDTWTIAYRKRTANRIRRVPGLALTWDEARPLAGRAVEARPELQVWYVPTADSQVDPADEGNVLTDTGKRVRFVETGDLADFNLTAPETAPTSPVPDVPVASGTPRPGPARGSRTAHRNRRAAARRIARASRRHNRR